MIPKIIHYCWFGKNPLPKDAKKYIASWKKYFPDYEIIEWNEDNYDVNCCEYTREAAKEKKWAFVSDFARFDILYKYGGIYFDTDVEVIRSLDDIINNGAFMGIESGTIDNNKKLCVASGLGIGAPAGLQIYKEIIDLYKNRHFYDSNGRIDQTTVVTIISDLLMKKGILIENNIARCCGITIYPKDYFCPQDYVTGKLEISKNTRTIHHYSSSWMTFSQKMRNSTYKYCRKYFGENIGENIGKIVAAPFRIVCAIERKTKYKKEFTDNEKS